MATRIGVLSDTHLSSYDPAMAAGLARFFAGVDMILHAGDLTNLAVLDMLEAPQVHAVAGNMDGILVASELPSRLVITVGGVRIGLTHGGGSPHDLLARVWREFEQDNVRCIVYGHSHRPMNEMKDGVLLFNPGAASRDHRSTGTVGILTVERGITGSIIQL